MSAPDRDESLFPELRPPAGGLAALRKRIADDEQKRARRFYRYAAFVPASALACALLVFLLLPKEHALPPPQLDGVVAARLGLEPLPIGVELTRDEGTRMTAVPASSSAGVDVVWIGAGSLVDDEP